MFQTENYLPFFSALQKYSKKKMLIIYPSQLAFSQVKKNEDIFFALKKIAQVKHFYSRYDFFNSTQLKLNNIKRHRLLILIYGIFSIFHKFSSKIFLYKSIDLFYTVDIPYTSWLINVNKLFFKSKKFSLLIYPFPFPDFKDLVIRVNQDSNNYNYIENFLKMSANTMISSYTANDLDKISKDLVKKFNIFTIGSDLYFWPTVKTIGKSSKKRYRFS